MKPIKLKMKSFLGFQNETIIDFEELYSEKIFLITGATGSGKTSIFDAITYALYGEGSGNERNKAKCYMSHLADKDDTLKVSLEFSVKGENYYIERFDSEYIASRKKAKFYKKGYEDDALTKLNEITSEVEHVIGLNAEQFKKIVMLPQGEFKEFLSSNTREKTDILKKLFATEIYEDLQRNIKIKYDNEKLENKILIDKFNEALIEIGLENEDIETGYDSLKELISKEKENNLKINKLTKVSLKKLNEKKLEKENTINFNKALDDFLNIEKKYIKLLNEKEIMEKKEKNLKNIYKCRDIIGYENRINEQEKLILNLENKLQDLKKIIENFTHNKEQNEKQLHKYKKEYIRLDSLKDELRNLEEKKKKISNYKNIDLDYRNVNFIFKELKEKLNKIKNMEKEQDQLKEKVFIAKEKRLSLSEEKSEVHETLKKKEETLIVLRELFVILDKIEKSIQEEKLILENKKITKKELELAEKSLEFENNKRKGNYALILKKDLKENEPCPVCGSKSHPGISFEHQNFDEDLIENLEESISFKTSEYKNYENKMDFLLYKRKDLIKKRDKLKKDYNINFEDKNHLKSIGKKFKEERDNLSIKENKLIKISNENDEFLKSSLNSINSLDDKLNKKEEIQSEYEKMNIKIIELEQNKKSLQLEKEDLDREKEIEDNIESITSKIVDINKNYDEALKIKNNDIEKSSVLITNKENLTNRIIDSKKELSEFKEKFNEKLQKEELSLENYFLLKSEVERVNDLEKEISLFKNNLSESYGMYSHLKETYAGKEKKNINNIIEEIEKLNILFIERDKEARKSDFKLTTYKNTEKKVKEFEKKYKEKREKLKILEDLYNTSSIGMTFETFVQSYHFEGILERANIRLLKMTKGRYTLRRRMNDDNKSKKTGLDIDIFDEYSGRERDVLSLSGGESFKASLALALGLSEFIESASGNVNLDTIFIDEGFGSLDEESLDSALECLLELNLSGRIVGIISHVAELKERIPKKIEVKSIPGEGSEVKIN